MLTATALFLVVLTTAHVGDPEAVDRPLSVFRDVRPAFGYPLFGLLALIGGLHLRTYYRLGLGGSCSPQRPRSCSSWWSL